jgi:hypothetical protein
VKVGEGVRVARQAEKVTATGGHRPTGFNAVRILTEAHFQLTCARPDYAEQVSRRFDQCGAFAGVEFHHFVAKRIPAITEWAGRPVGECGFEELDVSEKP